MKRRLSNALAAAVLLLGFLNAVAPVRAEAQLASPMPANTLSSNVSHVCGASGWLLAGTSPPQPAIYDATMSYESSPSGCGSIQLPTSNQCYINPAADPLTEPQVGQSGTRCNAFSDIQAHTPALTVTPGVFYTFKFRVRAEKDTPGGSYVDIDRTDGSTILSDSVTTTHAGVWEEVVEHFQVPSGVTQIIVNFTRYLASTSLPSKLWIDDLYLAPGQFHEVPNGPTKTFDGQYVKIDADGNFQVKYKDGTWHDYFPWCMMVDQSTRVVSGRMDFYTSQGWNCVWTSNTADYQLNTWVGLPTGYITTDWNLATSNNIFGIAARSVNATYAPDGMKVMMSTNSAVRGDPPVSGQPSWDPSDVTRLQSAITNLKNHPTVANQMLAYIDDAEDQEDKKLRLRAVLNMVDQTDKVGGIRQIPIITNSGLSASVNKKYDPIAGRTLTEYNGVYSGSPGIFSSARDDQWTGATPKPYTGYCQINITSVAWRESVYRCIGEGGKMIAFYADTHISASTGLPALPSAYPLDDPAHNPWWTSGDAKRYVDEVSSLMPLIKMPYLESLYVTSSNDTVEGWLRNYGGSTYLIAANQSTSPQSATLTLHGVSGTPTSLKNWFDGSTIPATVSGNTVQLTIPGLSLTATNTASRLGGGTFVAQVVGTTAVTPTTTTSTSTTTIAGPPTTTIDDPSFVYTPSRTTNPGTPPPVPESVQWVQYGPNLPAASGDYNSGNTVTSLAGATATISFNGTAGTLYGATGPYDGKMSVSVDGGAPVIVDTYSAADARNVALFSTGTLAAGSHTIKVTVLSQSQANPSSQGNYIVLDSVVVSNPGTGSTLTPVCAGVCVPFPKNTDPFVPALGVIGASIAWMRRRSRASRAR